MNSLLKKITLSFLTLCISFPVFSQSETSQVIGEYTVHYIAVNSSFISPEIAESYGIVRAPRNAFLNISVIKNTGGTGTSVTAQITGIKANLLGQNTALDFIEIREGDAIYYIGQLEFSNAENLRFNLEIQPENSTRIYPLNWTTKLYIN
ncbi:MAG: DUF4426 domain-containing protein [Gammaproteobacteria bacterium]|jgi:hypothetical protein|nr:DUF4426 domain-containing protein [Gammaproteobacteria bacterium]